MFLDQVLSHRFWFVLIGIAIVIGLPSLIRKLVQTLLAAQPEYNVEGRTSSMTPEQEKWVFESIHYLRSRIDGPQQMSADQAETNRMIRSQIRLSRLPGGFLLLVLIGFPLAFLFMWGVVWLAKWLQQFGF
ncbi:MAG: hypothetical protein ACR2JB_00390 [Bryobacteraceae bacterium]